MSGEFICLVIIPCVIVGCVIGAICGLAVYAHFLKKEIDTLTHAIVELDKEVKELKKQQCNEHN